jgi:hypothetical protein
MCGRCPVLSLSNRIFSRKRTQITYHHSYRKTSQRPCSLAIGIQPKGALFRSLDVLPFLWSNQVHSAILPLRLKQLRRCIIVARPDPLSCIRLFALPLLVLFRGALRRYQVAHTVRSSIPLQRPVPQPPRSRPRAFVQA